MRQKKFLVYVAIQALVLVCVAFIFKLNLEVKLASVEAGSLFVAIPLALGIVEWKQSGFFRMSFYIGLLQFWIFFALPILGLRLFNWDAPFSELSILGVPGTVLHQYANYSYILMMALTLWNYLRRR